jgi:cell division protein FtsI (penicillin-binding protein 3)
VNIPAIAALLLAAILTPLAALLQRALFLSEVDSNCDADRDLSIPKRLGFQACVLCVAAVIVVGRLYYLQGEQHMTWLHRAARQHETKVAVEGARGSIYDASGRTLAVSVEALGLAVHPHRVENAGALAKKLAPFTEKNEGELNKILNSSKRFVWLSHGLPRESREQLASISSSEISLIPEFRRFYPQGETGGIILGAVGRDGTGLAGMELAQNNYLSTSGYVLPVQRDAKGRLLRMNQPTSEQSVSVLPTSLIAEDEPNNPEFFRNEGSQLRLSVDIVIQEILESEFARGAEDAQAKRVFGLAMDADTGEILGLGQTATFDPNLKDRNRVRRMRNVSIQDNFEPGSTLKPIIAAAVLEANKAEVDEQMDCQTGPYRFGKHFIRDAHPVGIASFSEVLVQSSNICMAKLGRRMGKQKLYESLRTFGFGQMSDIELPGEAKGILRNHNSWRTIDIATHSFGQGVAVTALQLVRAYAALANGGMLVNPTVVKYPKVKNGAPVRIIRKEVAESIKQAILGVTESASGTGKRARIPGVPVYGKTGTAQKARKDGRGYDPDNVLASFIGFVDGKHVGVDRRIVLFVAVDEPGVSPRWGGTLAGPVFKRSMERILSHLLTQSSKGVQQASLAGIDETLS